MEGSEMDEDNEVRGDLSVKKGEKWEKKVFLQRVRAQDQRTS